MSNYWDKVTIEARLISLPDIYWKLKGIIDSHDYSMQDVSALIGYDPGMTARMLRIVNSSYFGFAAKIDTVHHAVSILGVQQIQDLVLATSIADSLGDYQCEQLDVRQFWQSSVYRAIAARNISGECNVIGGERMFVAGLLSAIGLLILYQTIPVLAQQARRRADDSGQALYLAEQETFGFDHARVAAALMDNWQLPASLTALIRNHLEPDPADDFFLETSILHVAVLMSDSLDSGCSIEEALAAVDQGAWDATGMTVEQCSAADLQVREQLSSVVSMLFPAKRRATA